MLRDLHLHTKFSDGANTLEEMALAAADFGLGEVCFTDHVRCDSGWWPEYQAECRRVAAIMEPKLTIRCGVEAKVIDFEGRLDVPPDIDLAIEQVAAIHRLPLGNGEFVSRQELAGLGGDALEYWLSAIRGIADNPNVTRLAHPFSLFPDMAVELDDRKWDDVADALYLGAYKIEYNFKYQNGFVPSRIWEEFRDRVVTGSDSHSVDDLMNRTKLLREYMVESGANST